MDVDHEFQDRVIRFREFLDTDFQQVHYPDKIRAIIEKQQPTRLIININHLRGYSNELVNGILNEPMGFIPPLETAIKEVALNIRPSEDTWYVGFEGNFGDHFISPRNINSSHLGKTICMEAIVTRCSLVRPKLSKSVHYCEETQLFSAKEYRDGLSLTNSMSTGSAYPKNDDNGNPLTTEFGFCTFKDFQMIYVQEMPERSPAGQLPRPIDVLCDGDLVDKVKPGDRITLVGTFRTRGRNTGSSSAVFNTYFLANNIVLLNKDVAQPNLTENDAKEIRKIAKRPDVFKLLSQSLAPSLYGHDEIKKALLLLLLGGIEKNLENGTHLRGDINILLIGDPSVGKSQMLRFVLNLAPLAIATTGRGSSGVGLTAAVTQDKETGERTLEAGAMVLADRGIVCIDEFDKMSDIDRVAIHEVMEQQTVTIAKAGIHTSLNARCSVLAAANPAFGSYLDHKKPFENITMPDSLLSRFDLVFIVLDKTDDDFNRKISEHITRIHRFIPNGVEEGVPMTESMISALKSNSIDEEKEKENAVFEKFNELLHIGFKKSSRKSKNVEVLSIPFLKKYLYYAKTRVQPKLSVEASDYISNKYSELRLSVDGAKDNFKTMPITPRTLETLIRLSTAHAKARLSKIVEQEDAEVAFDILSFALFKKVESSSKKRRTEYESDVETDEEIETSGRTRRSAANTSSAIDEDTTSILGTSVVMEPTSTQVGSSVMMAIADNISNIPEGTVTQKGSQNSTSFYGDLSNVPEMSNERFEFFKVQLNKIRTEFQAERGDSPSVTFQEIIDRINDGPEKFTVSEVLKQLQYMSDENMSIWYQPENESVLFF